MRKLVPILSLTLCAFLLVSLATPAAAQGTFPTVGDRLDYKILVDLLIKYAAGPPDDDFDIEVDMTHIIQNASGDLFWANVTTTLVGEQDFFGPDTGDSFWDVMLHHYGDVPHNHYTPDSDWSNYDPYWYTGMMFIPAGTEPGDNIYYGQSSTSIPYENNTYFYYGIPVMAGPTFTVGLNQLSTVMLGMDYLYHSNMTTYPSDSYWDMTVDFEAIWEWSLGFLCQLNFDFYINVDPYDVFAPTEIFVTGNMTLVDYSLAASPVAYLGGAGAVSPLPIIIAVIAVVIIICFIIFFLIWRSRSKGK